MSKLSKKEQNMLKVLGAVAAIAALVLIAIYSDGDSHNDYDYGEVEVARRAQSTSTSSRGRGTTTFLGRSNTDGTAQVSMNDFQGRNSLYDCWVLIEGKVYDITPYLQTLSNPQSVTGYCGTFGFEQGYLKGSSSFADVVMEQSQYKGTIR